MAAAARNPLAGLVPLGSGIEYVDDILAVLRPLALFEGFAIAECRQLCEYLECFGAPGGAVIVHEGEPGTFMAIVVTGEVGVTKRLDDGDTREVARLAPGAFFGEMSLIDGQPRFATCVTTMPSDLAVLTRDHLNRILIDHPRLGQKLLLMLLRLTTARLRETTLRMLPAVVDGTV
jgi:CRP-like cAMP-binding protein